MFLLTPLASEFRDTFQWCNLARQSSSLYHQQSLTTGCLVSSGRCKPSAVDDEWYSTKRPSSTVAVQHSGLYAEVSTIFHFYSSFHLDGIIICIYLLLCPSWDQKVFSFHYGGRRLHIFMCSDTAGVSLAKVGVCANLPCIPCSWYINLIAF